jgi:phosphatidylserine/phosphatidylglycerophosphate/cardiolipin synthase-like enzyme
MKRILSLLFLLIFDWAFESHLVGAPKVDNIAYAQKILINNDSTINKVLFVPDKTIKAQKVFLGLIENEAKKIHIASFMLTEKKVIEALCNAHQRGVKIKIIVDAQSMYHANEKISVFAQNGIETLIYQKPFSSMHHKFGIFYQNFLNGSILWSGSANLTHLGLCSNQEDIKISNDEDSIRCYAQRFKSLAREIKEKQQTKLSFSSPKIPKRHFSIGLTMKNKAVNFLRTFR